jgi:hypothetical protein
MRIVEHYPENGHKLLRIETQGCAVHISAGMHDAEGHEFTAIEVEPSLPADDESIWTTVGATTIIVRNVGVQVLAGDGTKRRSAAVVRHDVHDQRTA